MLTCYHLNAHIYIFKAFFQSLSNFIKLHPYRHGSWIFFIKFYHKHLIKLDHKSFMGKMGEGDDHASTVSVVTMKTETLNVRTTSGG